MAIRFFEFVEEIWAGANEDREYSGLSQGCWLGRLIGDFAPYNLELVAVVGAKVVGVGVELKFDFDSLLVGNDFLEGVDSVAFGVVATYFEVNPIASEVADLHFESRNGCVLVVHEGYLGCRETN